MPRSRSLSALLVFLIFIAATPGLNAGNWATFRGPKGTGEVVEGLPLGEGPLGFELKWKRP